MDRFSSALARRGAEPRAIIRERGNDLDPGERAAIALAQAKQTDVLLLIDEERGRQEAERRGIATAGTLGVLDAAAANGLLSLAAALQQLQTTNFYVSQRLLRHLLERDAGGARFGTRLRLIASAKTSLGAAARSGRATASYFFLFFS